MIRNLDSTRPLAGPYRLGYSGYPDRQTRQRRLGRQVGWPQSFLALSCLLHVCHENFRHDVGRSLFLTSLLHRAVCKVGSLAVDGQPHRRLVPEKVAWPHLGILSSSSRFSSFFTALVLGSLLLAVSWRIVIAVSAVIAGGVLLLVFLILKQRPADVGLEVVASSHGADQKRPHPLDDATLSQALASFARSPRVWLIGISVMCLTVLMEFQSFIPIYLRETFGLTTGIAAITSSAFPIGCLISVLAGGVVFDLLSKKKRIFVLGGMMVFSVLCVALLLVLPTLSMPGSLGLWPALLAIMLIGLTIAPCYYIPMSVFSVDFGGTRCGVLIGLIDAAGYLAAMAFDFLGGAVADGVDGWHRFLTILLGVSILGSVALPLFLLLDYRVPKQRLSS